MKRLVISIFCCLLIFAPIGLAQDLPQKFEDLPYIFIYEIEDNNEEINNADDDLIPPDLVDYVTQDFDRGENSFDDIELFVSNENDSDIIETLKDEINSIYLSSEENKYAINLTVPQKIIPQKVLKFDKKTSQKNMKYANITKYSNEEYNISGENFNKQYKSGDFSIGTVYGSGIDKISMLENSALVYTRYEKGSFALSSAYEKTMNTTIGTYSDALYLAPEFNFNDYISLRQVFGTDVTKNRKSGELILSLSPLGRKNNDRLRFEVGAKQTLDADNSYYGTQINFKTKFKL